MIVLYFFKLLLLLADVPIINLNIAAFKYSIAIDWLLIKYPDPGLKFSKLRLQLKCLHVAFQASI